MRRIAILDLLRAILLMLSLLFSSCGYHPGNALTDKFGTISVPYVEGDQEGNFTAILIREVASSLPFEYSSSEGELLLIVKLLNINDQNIGFRYDRPHHKHDRRSLVPVETRLTARAEVSLVNAATSCTVIPSVIISASTDLDHEYNATFHDANVFSLGQLSDAEAAFEAAERPLFKALCQKIVEYISYGW